MATLGELNILVSVKGLSAVKKGLGDVQTSLKETGKEGAKSFDGLRQPIERSRKQIDSFDKDLRNVHRTFTEFGRNLREVQIAATLFATTIAGPLLLSLNSASKTNRELNLSMMDIKNSTDNVMRSIGDSLAPIVRDLADHIKDLSKQWLELPKVQRDSIIQNLAWTAGILTAIAAGAHFLRVLVGLGKVITTPSGIIAVGLAGMIIASALLVDKWAKLNHEILTFQTRWQRIASVAAAFINLPAGIVQGAANIGMGIGQRLTGSGGGKGIVPMGDQPTADVDLGSMVISKKKESGVSQAMQGAKDELQKFKDEIDRVFGALNVQLPTAAQTIATALKTTFESFTKGFGDAVAASIISGQNFGEAIKQLMKNIAASVISFLVETIAKVIILRALGVIGPIFAGALGLGGGTAMADTSAGKGTSDVFTSAGKIFGFAEGGIVTKPTLGVFGESGPEAVIPLDKIGQMGGSIIVNMTQPVFLQDEASKDRFIRHFSNALKRVTNRRTGGTALAV